MRQKRLKFGIFAASRIFNNKKRWQMMDAVKNLCKNEKQKSVGARRNKSNGTSAGITFRWMIATLAVLASLFVFAAGFMTVDLRSGSIMKGEGGGYALSVRRFDDRIVITVFGKCYEITVKDPRQENVKE